MSRVMSGVYEFGPFRLDLDRRVFTREQQVVPLAPKTFELLVLLVQSAGRALSREELLSSLWPDTFVEEANLSFQVSSLRKALGEEGARWVETVPKHGYRFTAEVTTKASAAQPLRSARDELPVRLKRRTAMLWLAGASVVAALLAVFALLTVLRKPYTATVRTSPALAVPLTAYP